MMDGWHHAMQWLRWNSLNKAVIGRIMKGSILSFFNHQQQSKKCKID